jgi:hypothetical protein
VTILNLPGSSQALTFTPSGTFAFSVCRDDIIRQSMLNLALLEQSELPTYQETQDCARVLNMITKQLAGQLDRAPGFKMWQRQRGALFLSYSKYLYNLGSPNGDNFAGGVTGTPYPALYNQAQLTAPMSAGQLVFSIPAPIGVTYNVGDFVGLQYTNAAGNTDIFWTTVKSFVSATGVVTVNNAMPAGSSASGNAYVWNYTTKAQRPMKIATSLLRDINQNDTPLNELSVEQYEALPTKTMPSNVADPTAFYYEAQMAGNLGQFYIDCGGAQDITKHIHNVYLREAMDFNAPLDAPEFPQEWFWHLSWTLSLGIHSMFDADWTPGHQEVYVLATTNAREGNPQVVTQYFQSDAEDDE